MELEGCRLLNTRPAHQASSLTEKLEEHGASVTELPLIKVKRVSSAGTLERIRNSLVSFHWIVLTSANSVDFFFEFVSESEGGVSSLHGKRFAVVGEKTHNRLRQRGFEAEVVPEVYEAEYLAEELKKVIRTDEKVLFPRSSLSRDILIRLLKRENIHIEAPVLYETVAETGHRNELNRLLEQKSIDIIIFTSPSAVYSFFRQISYENRSEGLQNVLFAVIGTVTAKALQDSGFSNLIVPDVFTVEGLVEAIKESAGKR
ncbi:uroporphyrinogen-III synthase [Evansella sp. LMS18]|uniref:uroporphyrinogen-III synthase n=1 Tax=Evansella sp. LMS18 TaxID=2924033 RepID=UPI0020D091E1|nr:uroporphyrinogen-III synthase [Evansella sp. LMS18]UTR11272.1 uroporphyrinogen-III synthase [Evansella sp. LMS18]